MLYDWVTESDKSGTVRDKRSGRTEIASYSQEQIDKAVFFCHSYGKGIQAAAAVVAAVEFSSVERSLDDSSGEYGLSKRQVKETAAVLLNKENETVMRKPEAENNSDPSIENLMREKAELEQERNALPEQIHRLQMEKDALEVAAELLKKSGASI